MSEEPTKWLGSASIPDPTLDLPADPPPPVVHRPQPPVVYRPPPPPPVQPPPRRGGGRWFFWFVLLPALCCLACCVGCWGFARPWYTQYPASASTSTAVTGLKLVEDRANTQLADRLLTKISTDQLDEESFTQVYVDDRQRKVVLFGTTRFVTEPEKDLDAGFDKLTADLNLTGRTTVDPGPLGGHQRCAAGRLDNRAIAVCGWADHGSVAVAVFAGREPAEAGGVLESIRAAVITRGW